VGNLRAKKANLTRFDTSAGLNRRQALHSHNAKSVNLLRRPDRGCHGQPGHRLSDQTVGNILRRHDIPPAPKRKQVTSWKDFIRAHMAVLVATDFFTVEVLTLRGLITYYVLFFIHLESRRICLAGVTRHPDQEWMEQMARNVMMEDSGFLINRRYLLHDRDSKYCSSFRQLIEAIFFRFK